MFQTQNLHVICFDFKFIFSFHMNVKMLTWGFEDIIVLNLATLAIFGTFFCMEMKQIYNN